MFIFGLPYIKLMVDVGEVCLQHGSNCLGSVSDYDANFDTTVGEEGEQTFQSKDLHGTTVLNTSLENVCKSGEGKFAIK